MTNGNYGLIDDLSITLNGNQLYSIKDNAVSVSDAEYIYDGNGSLVSDANKGIANIEYDNMNNPRRIQFTNSNVTLYVYGDAGLNASAQPYKYNGKELDRMHGLDWYDYGARDYDAALAQWTKMDPLCETYKGINPYAYWMNNPINRIDPDGNKIVDSKGRLAVNYDKEGNIQYTKYADSGIRKIVTDLRLTKTGNLQLHNLINSKTNVRIHISEKANISNENYTYGETIQGNKNYKDHYGEYFEGKLIKIKDATITIYMGTIKEAIKECSALKLSGLTLDQAIGAVAAHEIVHATDEKEINADYNYERSHKNKQRPNRENNPVRIEKKVIEEYKQK